MKLNNRTSFHHKILIDFADIIGLINYYKWFSAIRTCFSKIEGSIQGLKSGTSPRVCLALGLAKTIPRESFQNRVEVLKNPTSNDNLHNLLWIIAIHLPFISSVK